MQIYLRNKSWKPECALSFNMGWRILVNFIPSFNMGWRILVNFIPRFNMGWQILVFYPEPEARYKIY